MFFQIIGSSSGGNCALFTFNGKNFLIDAGLGIRKIKTFLTSKSLSVDDLSGVFITHEHSDHCKALPSLVGSENLSVFANKITRDCIISRYEKSALLHWSIFDDGVSFDFCGMKITPFSLPHDAADAVGYCFNMGAKSLVWMTDLGKVTSVAMDQASKADVLVLESNYCPIMLNKSDRSFFLKQRINGTHGHLSNADAIQLLEKLFTRFPSKVYLAHVSRECNSVSHICELLSCIPSDFRSRIEIVSPNESGSAFVID